MRTRIFLFLSLSLLIVSGCAGFRGGVFSAPYIGEQEPDIKEPSTTYERRELQKLQLPGVKLEVSLNNLKRTYDYKVILYVIPTDVDLGDKPQNADERFLEVELVITPTVGGFVFDPRKAIVSIDGKIFETIAEVSVAQIQSPQVLDKVGNAYSFKLRYDSAIPSPESRISLDLSKALTNAAVPIIPLIKFKKLGWSAGYT